MFLYLGHETKVLFRNFHELALDISRRKDFSVSETLQGNTAIFSLIKVLFPYMKYLTECRHPVRLVQLCLQRNFDVNQNTRLL